MKEGIHPNYREVLFVDLSNGFKFVTRSCALTKETGKTGRRGDGCAGGSLHFRQPCSACARPRWRLPRRPAGRRQHHESEQESGHVHLARE